MGNKDPRIDEYISKAETFAHAPLNHLRDLIHLTCPDVEETIKWKMPFFISNGKILCSLAAYKNHMLKYFWRAKAMNDPNKIIQAENKTEMGHFGKISSIQDLPKDVHLIALLKSANKLNIED
jgi:hypothetical protein